jgi:NADH dehydrogenase/NADH:ubiquinone oxidoreductase subunit G
MTLIHLRIDGKAVECEEGLTILEAARQVGLYLPVLCAHPGLPADQRLEAVAVAGSGEESCGLCTVEIAGRGEPVRACETVVGEGMAVISDSASLREARSRKLAALLADHPPNHTSGESRCLICELRQDIARADLEQTR